MLSSPSATASSTAKAELSQYLSSKNINSLFVSIVEHLLIDKPENPIASIIEYLANNYPDQSKIALDSLNRAKSDENILKETDSNNAKRVMYMIPDPGTDAEDECEPLLGAPSLAKAKTSLSSRRSSVSAEPTDPENLPRIAYIPKSEAATARLLAAVSRASLLRALCADERELVVRAFHGPRLFAKGSCIIREGDAGSEFFLLDSGDVHVFKRRAGDGARVGEEGEEGEEGDSAEFGEFGRLVNRYCAGDCFGEAAILYNAPRAASCVAVSDCAAWVLDRVSFKAIVVAQVLRRRGAHRGFLAQVPILSSLSERDLDALADLMTEKRFSSGENVCVQGDAGDFFYIVSEGNAKCTQRQEGEGDGVGEAEERLVGELGRGDYFGEVALLTNKARQATVTASGELRVLFIDRAAFTRVFGAMDDLLKKNMVKYSYLLI